MPMRSFHRGIGQRRARTVERAELREMRDKPAPMFALRRRATGDEAEPKLPHVLTRDHRSVMRRASCTSSPASASRTKVSQSMGLSLLSDPASSPLPKLDI